MYTFRRAMPDDTQVVRDILSSRRTWLHQHGIQQWTHLDPTRDVDQAIERMHTWLLLDDTEALGTIHMSTLGDADFWTPDELDQPALYLSKLATRPEHMGRGLGQLLNDCATRYASERGIPRIRWDVWRSNDRLQAYYLHTGAQHLRTVEVEGRQSGALFELAYVAPRTASPVRIDAAQTHAKDVVNTHETPTAELRTPGGPTPQVWPDHWHRLPHLLVHGDTPEPAPMWVSGTPRIPAVLFNAGRGWRLHTTHTRPVTGAALDGLQEGHPYQVTHRSGQPCAAHITGDALNLPSMAL